MASLHLPNLQLKPYYELQSVLGKGSFGEVYKAVDTRNGEIVAIKQVKSIFDDVVDAKRMLREITILRTMNHANIVKIKDLIADS